MPWLKIVDINGDGRLLFPRTDVDLESYPVESIGKISTESSRILTLETQVSTIHFILDFNMILQDVTFSHGSMLNHREALLAGKIHSSLDDPSYKEALMKGVQYCDGEGWTIQPTPVVRRP